MFTTHRYTLRLSGIVSAVLAVGLLGCGAEPQTTPPGDGTANYSAHEIQTHEPTGGGYAEVIQPLTVNDGHPDEQPGDDAPEPFVFIYNGVRIYLRECIDDVVARIGEPLYLYEFPSCIFDGLARVYVYDGFEMEAFPLGDDENDSVIVIMLTEAHVSTANGVSVGQTYEDMVAAYGTDYETFPGGSFMFERNGDVLSFNIFGGVITSISYFVDDLY